MSFDRALLIRLLIGVVLFHAAAAAMGLGEIVGVGGIAIPDRTPGASELYLLVLLTVAALPVLTWKGSPRPVRVEALSSRELGAWVGLHLLLVLLAGAFITDWAALIDDEDVYLLQGALLAKGQLTEAAGPLELAGRGNPFYIYLESEGGGFERTGCYPFLAGLLTAPGVALGWPNLLWAPLGGLLVWHATRLSQRLVPDAPPHLLPMLLATSPALVGIAVVKHTSLLASLIAVLTARAVLARSSKADVVTGLLLGCGVLARPLDGVLLFACVGGALFVQSRGDEGGRLVGRGLRIALGGLPCLAVFVAYNLAITGEPLKMAYSLIFGGKQIFGFGATAYGMHTLSTALSTTALSFARLVLWGLPVPVLLWGAVASLRAYNRGKKSYGPLLAILAGHYGLYALAPFGQFSVTGVSYGLWALVPFAFIVVHLCAEDARWGDRVAALVLSSALTFVPYAVATVSQVRAHDDAPIERALELVAEHGPIVVMHHGFETHPSRGLRYHPPAATRADDEIIWWFDARQPALRDEGLRVFPDRPAFSIEWSEGPEPQLVVRRLR